MDQSSATQLQQVSRKGIRCSCVNAQPFRYQENNYCLQITTATVLNIRSLLNTRILIRMLLSTRTNLMQIGRKCYDCMHTPPDNVITETDVIIMNDAKTLHFKCAVNGRKIYLASFDANQHRSPNWPRPSGTSWTSRVRPWTSAPFRRRFRLNLYGCCCRCLGFRRVLVTLRLPAP